jgi:hypothetical protein
VNALLRATGTVELKALKAVGAPGVGDDDSRPVGDAPSYFQCACTVVAAAYAALCSNASAYPFHARNSEYAPCRSASTDSSRSKAPPRAARL